MQRWMEAKVQRAKVNGIMRSGAGRALGEVWDDRKVGADKKPDRGFAPPTAPRESVARYGRVFTVSPVLKKINGFRVAFDHDKLTHKPTRAERRAAMQW